VSTPIISPEVRDQALTQIMSVAAVLAAFPAVTLTIGGGTKRFTAALLTKQTTPANAQIIDENGDLLAITFLTQSPLPNVFTQKGLARKEAELLVSTFGGPAL
jgi:hypothetical protein